MQGARSAPRVVGSWVREPRRRSPDRGVQPRSLGARRCTSSRATNPCDAWLCERPDPEPWWRELWRVRSPGEHRRAVPGLARSGNCRRTDSRGEQGFEAGVLAAYRRAQCPRDGDGTCGTLTGRAEATGLAIAGNQRPGSCVGSTSGWSSGKELARIGESDREALADSALAVAGGEPARKQRPVRTGTAPREGKALKG